MKILVVHDREDVAKEIHDIVSATIPDANISTVEDGSTARSRLADTLFDLAIIDLTIPYVTGRTKVAYSVAEELLIELFEGDTLIAPGDVLGITKDEEALAVVNTDIGPHLMSIVHEDVDGQWRNRLADRVKYSTKTRNARIRSLLSHHDVDLAILTALDKERAPYEDIFELVKADNLPGFETFIFEDKDGNIRRGVLKSIGRAGQVSASSEMQSLLTQFRPELCIMSGFCGGLSAKVDIGDVLIAESIFDWDFGKWEGKGDKAVFVPRPEPIVFRDKPAHRIARELVARPPADGPMIAEKARILSDGRITGLKLRHIPFASGSAVVAHSSMLPRIKDLNENIGGVDMEAYGFAYAAAHTPVAPPEVLVIKAVADFCDVEKDDKDHEACSLLSARIAEHVALNLWEFARSE